MTETPLLKRRSAPRRRFSAGAWGVRVLLALCLAFFSEVFLWSDVGRPLWHWLPVSVGYLATATLLLSVGVQFGAGDVFGGLLLAGVYAAIAGLAINPAAMLALMPDTLVTRVMGAHFAAGVLALAVFQGLLRGIGRAWLITVAAIALGVIWGSWVRGTPLIAEQTSVLPATRTLLIIGGAGVVVLAIGAAALSRFQSVSAADLQLRRVGYSIMTLILVALATLWIQLGAVPNAAITPIVIIITYCLLVLWFQADLQSGHFLSDALPVSPPPWLTVVLATAGFLVAGAVAFQVPPPTSDGFGVLSVMTAFYGFLGLAWLPAVSVVFGVRAYRQQDRTGKML